MPATKRIDRPMEKKLSLPSSIVLPVDMILFSPLEGKVPKGAWAAYVTRLIKADLDKRNAGQSAVRNLMGETGL